MARGWESKDVAARQEESFSQGKQPQLAPDQLELRARIHSLELDQKRLEKELGAARHPRHAEMVRSALAHILEKISEVRKL